MSVTPTAETGDHTPTISTPEQFSALHERILDQLKRVVVGQSALLADVLAGMFAEGHVLLEGVPGLGKTVLLRTLGDAMSLDVNRVQCTPDLMPADIVGTTVLSDGGASVEFEPGPVFTQLLLADELNRATPKTQSALLEAMAERRVTTAGVTRELPRPFFVMATQNPIDMEGTYPLPEAQLDRFVAKALVPSPSTDDLVDILDRTTGASVPTVEQVATTADLVSAIALVRQVPMASHVTRHVADLIQATHAVHPSAPPSVRAYVRNGASPRGAQSLVLLAKVAALRDGDLQASIDGVRAVAHVVLRHRLVMGYEALAAGVTADQVIDEVLETVDRPTPAVRGAM